MKVLAGTSNIKLCRDIARQLKLKLVNSNIKRFADGEIYIEINENIRGNSVFVIQSTSTPANDNIMELLLCIDALRRSSAKNITAVIPYFGYARQDRKVAPRTSISAKVVKFNHKCWSKQNCNCGFTCRTDSRFLRYSRRQLIYYSIVCKIY